MSALRTNNPFFNPEAFQPGGTFGGPAARERPGTMTVQGAVNATFILLGVCVATAVAAWEFLPSAGLVFPVTVGASLLTLVLTMVAYFAPKSAPWVALPIAVCEGAFAGGASLIYASFAGEAKGALAAAGVGIVLQAVLLTVGVAGGMLVAYKTRLIPVTDKFRTGVVAATMGLCFLMLATLVLRLCGVNIPYIWDGGIIGIGFAGVVVVLAALNLVLDFDNVDRGAEAGLPKHMEWFCAIGVLVTLVWLYVSILRLLALLNRRD